MNLIIYFILKKNSYSFTFSLTNSIFVAVTLRIRNWYLPKVIISCALGKLWYSWRINHPMVWYSSLSGSSKENISLAFSMSKRPENTYSSLPTDLAT